MRRLTEDEFKATMASPPRRVGAQEAPPFDFWDYFDAVPEADLDGHDFSAGRVTWVWDMPGTSFQHVLVDSETPNVFLVLVLDVAAGTVAGHRVLDLDRLYGSPPPG